MSRKSRAKHWRPPISKKVACPKCDPNSGSYVRIPAVGETVNCKNGHQVTQTITGRIICNQPNLQNIPIKTDLGKEIKKAFIK